MDTLSVAVRLHHHLLTALHHPVELLMYAVQRQANGLTAQRSCKSSYHRALSLWLVLLIFVWFFCALCLSRAIS